MQGLELTYDVLARTRNEAAVDVLLSALKKPFSERAMALQTLVGRGEARAPAMILQRWEMLGEQDLEVLRNRKSWFADTVAAVLSGNGDDVITAIMAAESLQLTTLLPHLIGLAESTDSEKLRRHASQAVLSLSEQLGRNARSHQDLPSVRGPAAARLIESIHSFGEHGNSLLIDAFLIISTWGDHALRQIIREQSDSFRLICTRLSNSQNPELMRFLAGFLRCRDLDAGIAKLIGKRHDQAFRRVYLETIGGDFSATIQKNLPMIGIPRCLRGGEAMVQEVKDELGNQYLPALVQLYIAANPDHTESLHVVAAVAEQKNEFCQASASLALSKCAIPSAESLLRAAVNVAENNEASLAIDQNARLLRRMIVLLDHPDVNVVRGVARVLQSLHAENMIGRFSSLRLRSRRLLGRVVMMIDAEAVQRVCDGLRHPVLSHRLDAIAMADGLALVDLLSDSFVKIAREDHQEARIQAANAMANARGDVTLGLLAEMARLPQCPVRDAAVSAIHQRHKAHTRRTQKKESQVNTTLAKQPPASRAHLKKAHEERNHATDDKGNQASTNRIHIRHVRTKQIHATSIHEGRAQK